MSAVGEEHLPVWEMRLRKCKGLGVRWCVGNEQGELWLAVWLSAYVCVVRT